MKSQKSAVIFANIIMFIFYTSIFIFMISFIISIIQHKLNIIAVYSIVPFTLSLFGSLLTERTDNLEFKSNIIHKAIWYWNK